MYLSPCHSLLLHATTVTSLLPAAAPRYGATFSVIPSIHGFHLPSSLLSPRSFCSSFFLFVRSNLSARLFLSHTCTQRYAHTPTHRLTRSFFVLSPHPLHINSRLFSPFSSPSSSSSSCWHFPLALTSHHAYQRRGIPTPSNRRAGWSFARSPTSPLAYCFREFDEILPRDANGPPCTFFQLDSWSFGVKLKT